MPTFGSIPKARAVWEDWTAISASCCAVGLRFIAQSANTAIWSWKHIINAPDTSDASGLVLMSWSAGRTVAAVVLTDPDTSPSAFPRTTSMVPKYDGSLSVSRACSGVIPFFARSSQSLSIIGLRIDSSSIAWKCAFLRFCRPSSLPWLRISSCRPTMMRSTISRSRR